MFNVFVLFSHKKPHQTDLPGLLVFKTSPVKSPRNFSRVLIHTATQLPSDLQFWAIARVREDDAFSLLPAFQSHIADGFSHHPLATIAIHHHILVVLRRNISISGWVWSMAFLLPAPEFDNHLQPVCSICSLTEQVYRGNGKMSGARPATRFPSSSTPGPTANLFSLVSFPVPVIKS